MVGNFYMILPCTYQKRPAKKLSVVFRTNYSLGLYRLYQRVPIKNFNFWMKQKKTWYQGYGNCSTMAQNCILYSLLSTAGFIRTQAQRSKLQLITFKASEGLAMTCHSIYITLTSTSWGQKGSLSALPDPLSIYLTFKTTSGQKRLSNGTRVNFFLRFAVFFKITGNSADNAVNALRTADAPLS